MIEITAKDWELERHQYSNEVTERWVNYRIYSKHFMVKANACGSTDENVFCELSGSNGAKALNFVKFRLDQANKFKKDGDKDRCQLAAWSAINAANSLLRKRDKAIKNKDWVTNGKYVTRWDNTVTDEELAKLLKKRDEDAAELFTQCGGTQAPIDEARNEPKDYLRAEFE